MRKKKLKCRKCGYEGEIQVISVEEARMKRIPTNPPQCPNCGSYDVSIYA